jgi:hypothetical protein
MSINFIRSISLQERFNESYQSFRLIEKVPGSIYYYLDGAWHFILFQEMRRIREFSIFQTVLFKGPIIIQNKINDRNDQRCYQLTY